MRIYYNSGHKDFSQEEFLMHALRNKLRLENGNISSAKILERKFLSNEGHAIDGFISVREGGVYGLNIGQNPIGTGSENYIPFLEEMECQKIGGLYRVKSLIGKPIFFLASQDNWSHGYITPKSLSEIVD